MSSGEALPWLGFPLDVYDKQGGRKGEVLCQAYESIHSEDQTSYQTYAERLINYKCPAAASAKCPVTAVHHASFARGANSLPLPNSTFCSWVASNLAGCAQEEPKEVNVFVFGGSVAMGFGAYGCCCSASLNAKCATFNETCASDYALSRASAAPTTTIPSPSYLVPVSVGCSWSGRFIRWLNRTYAKKFNIKFKLQNLAEGAANSQRTSNVLHQHLKAANVSLTARDLAFFDHSINDAGYTPKVGEGSTFGVERLLRKVLMQSSNPPPPVLILETYPYLNPESNRQVLVDLSRHYNVLHWNYRNVVDDLAPSGSPNAASYDEHLRLRFRPHQDQHSSWHLHLFMAELLAGAFQRAVGACSAANTHPTCPPLREPFVLPPPLQHLPEDSHCSRQHGPLVNIDAMQILQSRNNANNAEVGAVHVSGGFVLKEDRPRKFGWVVDLDALGSNATASVVFSPHTGATAALAALLDGTRVILRIFFLATYVNAGLAQVSFCGVPLSGGWGHNQGTIDALWPAFNTYHVSSPELYEQEVKWHGDGWSREEDDWKVHRCPGSGRDLEVTYRAHSAAGGSVFDAAELAARQRQKLRIIGAKVCISQMR